MRQHIFPHLYPSNLCFLPAIRFPNSLPVLRKLIFTAGGHHTRAIHLLNETIGPHSACLFPSLATIRLATHVEGLPDLTYESPAIPSTGLNVLDLILSMETKFPKLSEAIVQEQIHEARSLRWSERESWTYEPGVIEKIEQRCMQEEMSRLCARAEALGGKTEKMVGWLCEEPGRIPPQGAGIVVTRRAWWPMA